MLEEKLRRLNIILPKPPKPVGAYVPVRLANNFAFVSGQIPIQDGKVVYAGKVPTEQSIEGAQNAAKLCIINALAQLKQELGSLDRIKKIIRISGYVNASDDFATHPQVINGASDFLFDLFGTSGQHSRIAIGVSSLPLNSTVEIDLIVEFE